MLNVRGEGKARPSGRNPQAEAKSPPEKLADKTVQPLARQIATTTISKTAADPLSANVATLENPKWFAATIPVEKRTLRRHRVERRHSVRVHRFTAAASANSIAFPPHKDSATKPMAAQMVQMYNIYQTRERTSCRERKKQENQMFFIVFELWKTLLGFRSCLLLEFVHHLPLFPLKVYLRAHKNLRLRLHRALLCLNSKEFLRCFNCCCW